MKKKRVVCFHWSPNKVGSEFSLQWKVFSPIVYHTLTIRILAVYHFGVWDYFFRSFAELIYWWYLLTPRRLVRLLDCVNSHYTCVFWDAMWAQLNCTNTACMCVCQLPDGKMCAHCKNHHRPFSVIKDYIIYGKVYLICSTTKTYATYSVWTSKSWPNIAPEVLLLLPLPLPLPFL